MKQIDKNKKIREWNKIMNQFLCHHKLEKNQKIIPWCYQEFKESSFIPKSMRYDSLLQSEIDSSNKEKDQNQLFEIFLPYI